MFSIIVPIYNAEQYIQKCVESVLCQTYADFELILVDDGSIDNSGDICDQLALSDARIKVYHSANGGVAHARNIGLRNSQGDWICFLDADDYVGKNWLKAYEECLDGDLIVQGCKIVDPDLSESLLLPLQNVVEYDERYTLVKELSEKGLLNQPWNKCYKADIIREHNLLFVEGVQLSEDLIFVLDFLNISTKLRTMPVAEYIYNRQNSNLTRKFHIPRHLVYWKSRVIISTSLYCKGNYENSLFMEIASKEFAWLAWYTVDKFFKMSFADRCLIYSFLKSLYFGVAISKMKFAQLVFVFLPLNRHLFDIVLRIYSFCYSRIKMALK